MLFISMMHRQANIR